MHSRTNYEMTGEQLHKLIEASAPTICMMIGGSTPSSPQENTNTAWASLGLEMGFDSSTVQPRLGFTTNHFTAMPTETETQKKLRISKERAKKDFDELADLEALLLTTESRISELKQKAE